MTITGAITYGQAQVGSIANHDTDALAEGSTNLYFTNERVDDRVAALIDGGTGISATYNDSGNILSISADFTEFDTDNVVEGTSNKYHTQARVRNSFTYGTGIQHDGSGGLQVTQSDINTDNITEGSTNLFITAARTRGHLSATGDLSYNASTGVFSYTIPTTIASLSNHDTADLAEGTNLYFTNARADARADARIAAASTSDLSEGTNLYHTTARARAAISAGGDLSYNASTGVMSVTLPTVFSGAYNDLTGKPTLFSGAYADLTGAPSLGAVATSNDYDDLSNKPTLGTAAATAASAYATAAQGALAASALQAETITLSTLKSVTALSTDFADFQSRIAAL